MDHGAFHNSEITRKEGRHTRFSFLYFWLFFSLQNWAEKRRQWTFILWNRPSIANFSLGHLFMIKLKTFEIRSLSWKCWQILTQRRAIGQHNNMKKALPQAQLPKTKRGLCFVRWRQPVVQLLGVLLRSLASQDPHRVGWLKIYTLICPVNPLASDF